MKKLIFSFLIVGLVFSFGCDEKKEDATQKEQLSNVEGSSNTIGKTLFKQNCEACHGKKGEGDGLAAQAMPVKPRNFVKDKFKQGDDLKSIQKTIKVGVPGTQMVAFSQFTDAELEALAKYVRELTGKK